MVGADAVERPDAQRQVIRGAHHRLAVRRERDAVDVLRVPFEHARLAAAERPEPHRVIPGRRREPRAVGRNRERHDRRRVPFQHRVGLRACPRVQIAMRPSSPAVTARPSRSSATAFTASSWKRSTCSAALRASDQRIAERIEAARDRARAVGRHRDRAHRPAMAAQLRLRGRARECDEEGGKKRFHRGSFNGGPGGS